MNNLIPLKNIGNKNVNIVDLWTVKNLLLNKQHEWHIDYERTSFLQIDHDKDCFVKKLKGTCLVGTLPHPQEENGFETGYTTFNTNIC